VVREDRSEEPTQREHSLDQLAKGLANRSITRRQAFRWFGGAFLGGILASLPVASAWAQGSSPSCPPGTHPCPDGTCAPLGQGCPPTFGCPQGEVRVLGQCQCGTGPSCTGGNVCVDGQCVCPQGTHHVCPDGTCVLQGVPCNPT